MSFSDNLVGTSGADLFGGFLDRCMPWTNETDRNITGLESFQRFSNINESGLDTISSLPVQVCFCVGGIPDCTYKPHIRPVLTEKPFTLEVIAQDHVSQGVNATFD